MQYLKDFIKSRGVGFYFTIVSILLMLIQVILYAVSFSNEMFIQYKHWTVIFFMALAIVAGLGLSLTRWTRSFAPLAIFVLELLSFLMFAKYGYWYFTEVFFGGVVNAETIGSMYWGYKSSIVLYVLVLIASGASIFIKQAKNKNIVGEVE